MMYQARRICHMLKRFALLKWMDILTILFYSTEYGEYIAIGGQWLRQNHHTRLLV